jgi:2-oxoglutarate ferredoxin oxidoreductase subunit beta
VFERPRTLEPVRMHYCPGCTHGIVHRLLAEVMDEMELAERAVGIASVGCSVFAYDYFTCDMIQAAHGRAPAVATGVKRMRPDLFVFAYQGDGDLASIGIAETIHAAARGENISIIFINNAVYGMTGGQMAPTTMLHQRTTTTPVGRDAAYHGHPIRVCELLATLDGPAYLERVALSSPQRIRHAKRAIRKAFLTQIDYGGYSLVELLSPCPVRWRLSPLEAMQFVEHQMTKVFPLGVFRDWEGPEADPPGKEDTTGA